MTQISHRCTTACLSSLSTRVMFWAVLLLILATSVARAAADRDRIETFLTVTGFDVALDSIALSAESAPQMLGMEPDAFGSDWTRVTQEVFDTEIVHGMAVEILEATLTDALLDHAVAFYGSDLGRRLLVVENASHMEEDDTAKQEQGSLLIADMVKDGSPRLDLIKRMITAIDVSGTSLRALQEIQVRFLLTASAAGVVELQMDETELRALLKTQESELRRTIQQSALAGSAYTYRDFSDDDLEAYVVALEQPMMQQVYELLNAVQYELMANRFEALAVRMARLHPGQDI